MVICLEYFESFSLVSQSDLDDSLETVSLVLVGEHVLGQLFLQLVVIDLSCPPSEEGEVDQGVEVLGVLLQGLRPVLDGLSVMVVFVFMQVSGQGLFIENVELLAHEWLSLLVERLVEVLRMLLDQ